MFRITTLNTHSSNGHTWQKGQTGENASQLRHDAEKHHGVVSGNLGFNGTTKYDIISGVIFATEENRAAFLREFGDRYNAQLTDKELVPGIDTDDIWF